MERLSRLPEEPLAEWYARVKGMHTKGWSVHRLQTRDIVLRTITILTETEDRTRKAVRQLKRSLGMQP